VNEVRAVFTADLQLLRDGSPVNPENLAFAAHGSDGVAIAGLLPHCSFEGDYELRLDAGGISGPGGEPGFGTIATAWTLDVTPPSVVEARTAATALAAVPGRDGTSMPAVDAVRVTFSERLRDGGLSLQDLTLKRDGVPVQMPPDAYFDLAVVSRDGFGNTREIPLDDCRRTRDNCHKSVNNMVCGGGQPSASTCSFCISMHVLCSVFVQQAPNHPLIGGMMDLCLLLEVVNAAATKLKGDFHRLFPESQFFRWRQEITHNLHVVHGFISVSDSLLHRYIFLYASTPRQKCG
jgi:hypothetical protein